jgi:hypothetical protein
MLVLVIVIVIEGRTEDGAESRDYGTGREMVISDK